MTNYTAALLSLMVVDLLAAASPGPNLFLITQTAIHRGRRSAAAVLAGFVFTNLLWCLAVVFGLGLLFAASPLLYRVVKIAGGAYLLYVGISLWSGSDTEPSAEAAVPQGSSRGAFARGALTNLANPKAVVYFGSVFALFLAPGTPAWVQAAAVAIVLGDTILWYGTVAALFSSAAVQRRYVPLRKVINRGAGAAMGLFGLRLITADE